MPLNIDLKTIDVAAPSIATVRHAGPTGDVVISGCQVECLEIMAAATNEITTLLNLEDPLAGLDPAEARAFARQNMDVAGEFGAAGINLPHTLVDADLVARAEKVGLGVWVFTVDDEQRLTTNWPARMLAWLGNRSSAANEESDG